MPDTSAASLDAPACPAALPPTSQAGGSGRPIDYGMSYYLGRSCWHVVGYVNNDVMRSVLLCGGRRSEYGIGGGASDVLASHMPVCKTCDRATSGGAAGDVERLLPTGGAE